MDVRTIFSGFVGITVVMLVGCSDPAPPPSSGVTNVTLNGTAAKGIISLGNVVAEELKADGAVRAQVGSATTDSDGYYSLTVSNDYLGGPIKVTVSADTHTQMKCDVPAGCGTRIDGLEDIINPAVVDFGEWYKPGTLNMMALVAEAAAGAIVDVSITPYTDLATNYALDTGSLTPAGVYNANSEISNLLNINILKTRPVDITDIAAVNDSRAKEVVYAAVSAAVLTDVTKGSGSPPDINSALGTLTKSFDFNGGTMVVDDTGTALDDSAISLQEIVDGALSILDQIGGIGGISGIADISGLLAALQAQIDAVTGGSGGGGGIVDPAPGDTADAAELVKVKAFVGDVRTWGSALEADAGPKGSAFEAQTTLVSSAAEISMDFLIGQAFFASVEAIEMRFHGRNTSPDLVDYTTGLSDSPQFTAGGIEKSGDEITITDGLIDGVTVNISMRLPENGTVSALSNFSIEIVSASFESAATDAYINSGKVTFQLASEYVIDWTAIEQGSAAMPGILNGEIDLAMQVVQKQDKSGMPLGTGEMTFEGDLSVTFVNPSSIIAAGDISGVIPTVIVMNGGIRDDVGNSFDGRFTFNVTNANILLSEGMLEYVLPSIGLDFKLQLVDLPEAIVNVNGIRTDVEKGITTTTITFAGRRIEIESDLAVLEGDVSAIGGVTIINQDGVEMVIDGNLGELEGDVLFNGKSYAAITQLDNGLAKVTYSDGTFEIL